MLRHADSRTSLPHRLHAAPQLVSSCVLPVHNADRYVRCNRCPFCKPECRLPWHKAHVGLINHYSSWRMRGC